MSAGKVGARLSYVWCTVLRCRFTRVSVRGAYMGKILLKPVRADVNYQGQFADFAFETLATPAPLYRSLLKHLRQYEFTLDSLSYESHPVSETKISCYQLALSTHIWIRLNRLEIAFLKMHEVGGGIAQQILLGAWNAIQEVSPSIQAVEHRVQGNIDFQIQDATYDSLIRHYVTTPSALGEQTRAGVVFYLPQDATVGVRGGHVILDSGVAQEPHLGFRMLIILDAQQVPVNTLDARVNECLIRYLDCLGLALEQENKG